LDPEATHDEYTTQRDRRGLAAVAAATASANWRIVAKRSWRVVDNAFWIAASNAPGISGRRLRTDSNVPVSFFVTASCIDESSIGGVPVSIS
jgi:hypothetical protein